MSGIFHALTNNIIPNETLIIYFAGLIKGGRGAISIINKLKENSYVIPEYVGDHCLLTKDKSCLSNKFIHDKKTV